MANARYLEIDSNYRNRNEWPQAGKFVIPISQTGRKGAKDAVDPVSESAAEVTWMGNSFDMLVSGPQIKQSASGLKIAFVSATPPDGIGGATGTGQLCIILTAQPGHMQVTENYYINAVLTTVSRNGDPTRARIVTSKYLGLGTDTTLGIVDRMEVRILNASNNFSPGTWIDIEDPTDLSSTTDPVFFVPNGRLAPNAYPGTILHNLTRNEYRYVSGYSAYNHLLQVDTSTSAVSTKSSGPTTNWDIKDTYSIRSSPTGWCGQLDINDWNPPVGQFINTSESFNLPITATNSSTNLIGSFLEIRYKRSQETAAAGVLRSLSFASITSSSVMALDAATSSSYDDFYKGYEIRLSGTGNASGQIRKITSYVGSTQTITVSPPFTDIPVGTTKYQLVSGGIITHDNPDSCSMQARRIIKYVDYRDTAIITNNTITFPFGANENNNYYKGLFIRVTVGGSDNLRMITNYTVTRNGSGQVISRVATVGRNFTLALGTADFTITSGMVFSPFTLALSNQEVCILPFSYDNLNPFVYTGSMTSIQDVVCYEIELLNLVLPNQVLAVAGGGYVSYYPYVYVQLQNIDASGGSLKNIIYSNNPNSTSMLFRAAVDDVPNPLSSTFIKIDGDGAVQTIKFKPNDNLLFSVHMPNGEIYQTLVPEAFSPCRPNHRGQVSAYFRIKRL